MWNRPSLPAGIPRTRQVHDVLHFAFVHFADIWNPDDGLDARLGRFDAGLVARRDLDDAFVVDLFDGNLRVGLRCISWMTLPPGPMTAPMNSWR